MCSLLLAVEALPKGGILRVEKDTDGVLKVSGEGDNAGLRDGFSSALDHEIPIDDMDPKYVHPYITGILLKHYGFELEIDESENNFIFLRLKSSNVS